MNKKITVKTQIGDIRYCIIDFNQDVDNQLAQVHGHDGNHGISARLTDTQILVVDYFHDSLMGAHDILAIEDTDAPVSLKWNTVTQE